MNYNIKIKKISWIGDSSNKEADVIFETSLGMEFTAFCYPCSMKEGEKYDVELDFVEGDEPIDAFWNQNTERIKDIFQSKNESTKYFCYGIIKSINPVIVDCNQLEFNLGNLTNDVKVIGSYVYFSISRLDIMVAPGNAVN